MKTTLTLLLAIMLSACAQLSSPFKTSVEIDKEECRKIGYTPNTQPFFSCVERQSINIRNNR
jgi:hypothetical protein